MKLQRIVIRPGRKFVPRIPNAHTGEKYILFRVEDRKVTKLQLFTAHAEAGGINLNEYTHYALLPSYISR